MGSILFRYDDGREVVIRDYFPDKVFDDLWFKRNTETDCQIINNCIEDDLQMKFGPASDPEHEPSFFRIKYGFEDQYIGFNPHVDGWSDICMLVKDPDGYWLFADHIETRNVPKDDQECDVLIRTLAARNSGCSERVGTIDEVCNTDLYRANRIVYKKLYEMACANM